MVVGGEGRGPREEASPLPSPPRSYHKGAGQGRGSPLSDLWLNRRWHRHGRGEGRGGGEGVGGGCPFETPIPQAPPQLSPALQPFTRIPPPVAVCYRGCSMRPLSPQLCRVHRRSLSMTTLQIRAATSMRISVRWRRRWLGGRGLLGAADAIPLEKERAVVRSRQRAGYRRRWLWGRHLLLGAVDAILLEKKGEPTPCLRTSRSGAARQARNWAPAAVASRGS